MTDVRKLTWTLTATDSASDTVEDVDDKVTGLGAKMKKVSGVMETTGRNMTKKVTAPLVGIGVASLKTVSDFDDGMSRVRGLTGATGEEFDQLRDKARELGANTAYSASEASEGMQVLAASGMEVNDILETSEDMFTLMSAGAVDADTAASVLTNTMAQFNLSAEDSGRIVDVFAKGSAEAKLGVDDLEYIMSQAGGTMASMNMDMEQSVALAGQLANAGAPVGQLGTVMNAMGREVKANADAFQNLGIDVYDSSGEIRDMGSVLGDLEVHLEGMTDAQRDATLQTLFSGQAMQGVQYWLQDGKEGYDELTESIYNSTGAGKEFADTNEDNIGGALRSLGSKVEDLFIEIGDVIKEPIQKAAEFIGELTEKFKGLSPEAKKAVVAIAGIAIAIGPVLSIGGKLMKSMSPAKMIMLGIVVAGTLIYKNWDKIAATGRRMAEVLKGVWESIKSGVRSVGTVIEAIWESVKGTTIAIWEGITGIISGAWETIKTIVSTVGGWIMGFLEVVGGIIQAGAEIVWGAISTIISIHVAIITGIINGIKAVVEGVIGIWNKAKDTAKAVGDAIGGAWQSLRDKTASAWNSMKSSVTGVIDSIRDKWQGLKDFFSKPIKGAIDIVSTGWNKVTGRGGKTDGSHRTGKARVPFDGYIAELHENEEVLRADDPRNVNNKNSKGFGSVEVSPVVNVVVEGSARKEDAYTIGKETSRAVKQEIEKTFIKLGIQGV